MLCISRQRPPSCPWPAKVPQRDLQTPLLGTLKTPVFQLHVCCLLLASSPSNSSPSGPPLQCDRALQVAPHLPSGGQDGGGSAAASGLPLRLQQVNKGSTVPSASLFRGAAAPGGSALDGPHGACAGPGSLRCERGRPTGSDRNVTDRVPSGAFLSVGLLFDRVE